ncbi:MAG: polyprenyl synthetase family protein [Spirochaetaceae bacterium]|jgi:heptaprenyl diphosphate synthase|nr:polyprenyl synthetase family protein [Spirochaetaceae bacterium]
MPEALEKVSGIINSSSASENPVIFGGLSAILNGDGKLLRPGLLVIASQFGSALKYNSEKCYHLAAAIEMLHVATLIHDDVIDDSPLRRGQPSVHTRYGKQNAVLMGDFLLSRCFILVSEYSSQEQALALARAVSVICSMEIEQNSDRYQADTSVRRYFKKIMGKTALLFSLACYVGAAEAKAPAASAARLRRAGYNMGMAFQIIDDILDYAGTAETVRKALGNDFKEGIVTLPLICALKMDRSGELKKLTVPGQFALADRGQVIALVRESGGIEAARNCAKKYTDRALREISLLPGGAPRDMLEKLTQRLLVRDY